MLDAADVDMFCRAPLPPGELNYDLNDDGLVNEEDHRIWVKEWKHTWYGDANLDLEFNSSDMVKAFVDGGYEKGPRADAVAVPEPGSAILLLASLIVIATHRRRFDP